MSNRLDAKDAFAFSIDLQGQLAAVQLEDRQIIRRSLDRDFPFGPLGSPELVDTFAKLRRERKGVEWARDGVILRMSSSRKR